MVCEEEKKKKKKRRSKRQKAMKVLLLSGVEMLISDPQERLIPGTLGELSQSHTIVLSFFLLRIEVPSETLSSRLRDPVWTERGSSLGGSLGC